jgi:hypothetical protein
MLGQLDRVDLDEFDAILVPELRDRDELPLEALDRWVRGGGVLVVVGDATAALVDSEEPWTTVERITDLADLSDEDGRLGDLVFPSRADDAEGAGPLPPERKPLRTPGAIARLDLDAMHYLSVGEGAVAYAPVLSDRLLTPSITGQTVARFDAEAPRRAGFAWPAMEEGLKGKAFLVEERRDRGRVILFAEDPGFRGTWEGLHRLLLNGLLLGPNVKGL